MRFFLATALVVAALAPTASADANASIPLYECVDEPPYPTAPGYSGDFCVNGQFGGCLVIHHWDDNGDRGQGCYVASPDVGAAGSAFIYKCIDEPHYPTHPDYSGGFCIDGQLGAECPVRHYWTDAQGSGEICYTDAVDADLAAPSGTSDDSSLVPPPPCVQEPPYPTHPDYSGGFCLSQDRSCAIYHHWTQDGEYHNECYVGPSAEGPL